MISKQLTGLTVAAIVLLTACSKNAPGFTQYIPKDASNVISIDVKSMLTKLNSDSLTVENMLAAVKDAGNEDQYTKAITKYNELKDAGIDFENKVFVSVSSLEMMSSGGTPDVQMVAGVKDAAKIEAFLKKQMPSNEIVKGDGFSYVTEEEDNAIGWNKDALIVVYAGHKREYPEFDAEDTTGMTKPKSVANAVTAVEKLKKYFKQTKDESILSVKGFNDLQGQTADVAIFNQTNLEGINAMAFAFVPKLKELIEGTYSTTTINFENGKAVAESKTFVGKKMGEILKKYAGPEVDMSLLENYPSQNVDGVVAFSFKPELIPAIIKETGLDALLGLGLAQTGMGIDDFAKIFKGDFAVAVSDFSIAKQDAGKDAETYSTTIPTAKMIFTAKIGDKAAFEKLVSLGVKQGFIIRNGNSLVPADNGVPTNDMPFRVSTANDMLTMASDSATLAAYQSKSQKIGLADEVRSKLKGNAIGAFVDVERILNGISTNLLDSSDAAMQEVFAKSKATFKSGWITCANFDGKSVNGKAEMVFMDAKKNSLAQIVRFGMFAAEKAKSQRINDTKSDDVKSADVVLDSIPTKN